MKKTLIIMSCLFLIALLQIRTGASLSKPAEQSPGFRVSGHIAGIPAGKDSPSATTVRLLPQSATGGIITAQIRTDGTFEFSSVHSGKYFIVAKSPSAAMENPETIEVSDHDVTNIELVLIDTEAATLLEGLQRMWSLDGTWGGLAADANRHIVFASSRQGLAAIDSAGRIATQSAVPFTR